MSYGPRCCMVFIVSFLHFFILSFSASAQVSPPPVIGGNVYGGGNRGNVEGSTTVQVKSGDVNKIFGGARMADVGGNAYVNIDGKNATGYTLINYVYGGNDIAGNIGTAEAVGETLPLEIVGNEDGVDITWNTYVHLSTKTVDAEKTYIGQLFAGGNGDYYYKKIADGDYRIYSSEADYNNDPNSYIASRSTDFNYPELAKTYLDIQGGSIVYAYGGGNKATVTEKNVIHVDNPSTVVNHVFVKADGTEDKTATEENPGTATDLLTPTRLRNDMDINMGFSHPTSAEFQIGRLFGGNNLADMAIRPKWNLQSGKIRNLYSGGNRGNMTSPEGLLLEIDPASTNTNPLVIDYVYGGCRMADVKPTVGGEYTPCINLQDKDGLGNLKYKFPDELSARVLVRGGDINTVYGGNDITGRVYGGNAIGIYTSIRGDVYGGGNGAYPYTDNSGLRSHDIYGDLFYNVTGGSSVKSLNEFRPNAEQVSIRLAGTSLAKPTIIGGSVYLGGNCATLKPVKEKPLIELKMGSYVIADKVFLGNNGEGMVTYNAEKTDASGGLTQREGVLRTLSSSVDGKKVSQIKLTDKDEFSDYMEGVAMDRLPNIVFDQEPRDPATYVDYSSYIGSFFCGGNRGSMTYGGTNMMTFDHKLIVYDKLVGGSNNANVAATTYNAAYEGGIKGTVAERTETGGKTAFEGQDRLVMNFNGLKIQPKRLYSTEYVAVGSGTTLTEGDTYYKTDAGDEEFDSDGTEVADGTNYFVEKKTRLSELEWNTAKWKTESNGYIEIGTGSSSDTGDDYVRRLLGGNIYGGCYTSGHVNGNVTININQDIIERYGEHGMFADVKDDDSYEMKSGGERRSGVILDRQGDDVMTVAMTVFGGGCGEDTEIWGSTTINHNNGYCFQIFGGGEEGMVGKKKNYAYDAAYSTTVNLKGLYDGYEEGEGSDPLPETEYIYGAGNEGDVCGDSYVNLGNGRIYDAFGGASNADILGGTEVYIGRQPNGSGGYKAGFPWIRDNVYGGNDFGGIVKGKKRHDVGRTPFDPALLESATYVKYIQGRVDTIFGGNYGSYNYTDPIFQDYTYYAGETGIPQGFGPGSPRQNSGFSHPHLDYNSFVHFQPVENAKNKVGIVFGGSEGVPGQPRLNNLMQEKSYVLIDDTQTSSDSRYAETDIFGGGAYAGLGNSFINGFGSGRSLVDLYAGSFHNVYGGSAKEGIIGYTHVNVPATSTIKVNAIFGGGRGYGVKDFEEIRSAAKTPAELTKAEAYISKLPANYCDHYVTCIDYKGAGAIVEDAIYGGNQNRRIACDTYINIEAPVMQSSGYQATIYGAGYGDETVSGRTNVFMNSGSVAYKVFGGGRDGNVFNYASLANWLGRIYAATGSANVNKDLSDYRTILNNFGTYIATNPINLPTNIGTYVNPSTGKYDGTFTNDILPAATDPLWKTSYKNTNVHLMQGSNVTGYAYGGGFGADAVTSGTTYIELKGGNVDKDIYGGGQGGPVMDEYSLGPSYFTATTNVYIEGGMARNVYGGGYLGDVGKHTKIVAGKEVAANINEAYNDTDTETFSHDILAEANVTIGKTDGTSFLDGIPAIMRNAYGGGEGGSVFGTANITLNNGYIGYRYKNTAGEGETPVYKYVEELDDGKPNAIEMAGNLFGGGYVVNSYVDNANVTMYGGTLRGSLYGGGELGTIGAGTTKNDFSSETGIVNGDVRVFRAGKTHIKMFDGHVKRNVFGGGRGQDSWGGDGTLFMDQNVVSSLRATGQFCKGYVFGQTEVNIHGGEIGTSEGMARGYGNVFGGGDIGFVYSAYELDGKLCIGKQNGERYDGKDNSEGYYYKYEDGAFKTLSEGEYVLTEDCKVLVEPWCKAKTATTINGESFAAGAYVPTSALNTLGNKNTHAETWEILSKGPTKADKDKDGVLIHNAVFAGGNTSPGSTEVYAATKTVFGNATASIHDVYNRDLITVGTGRTGGLYGDGNLTLVDGYRELNVTNYGTDYHSIKSEITKDEYDNLPDREAAYYEIRYRCLTTCRDKDGKTYTPGSTISADELQAVFDNWKVDSRTQVIEDGKPKVDANGYPVTTVVYENGSPKKEKMLDDNGEPNPLYWTQNGVCSRYAGRLMNTIQRADFCGVFGSRMVMMGALDRVPATVDYTKYTINRVREVSLNKKTDHGNYFGIYSNVNYLGALTSDVDFGPEPKLDNSNIRTTDSDNHKEHDPDLDPTKPTTITLTVTGDDAIASTLAEADAIDGVTVTGSGSTATISASTLEALYKLRSVSGLEVTGTPLTNQTYYNWKALHHDEKKRNNGSSWNKVALASGVYLELTSEKGTGDGLYEKDWGYITGVVELDLISVQPGLGGGFVYAKNEHGVRSGSGKDQTILTALNLGAVTNKHFTYTPETDDPSKKEWETSGNFVHSSQTIIDDCYNIGGRYLGTVATTAMPAHYWYIKGSVYVYDQYISAYTGSPNAYSEIVNIPLTISSAAHGRMKLLDVQPNRYAYYTDFTANNKLGTNNEIILRDVSYKLNDPISYWDYYMLSKDEKKMFVDKTYVTTDSCELVINGSSTIYPPGYVMLPAEYDAKLAAAYSIDLTPDDNIDNPVKAVKIATIKKIEGEDTPAVETDDEGHPVYKAFADVFHESNNVSHNTGYILTYKVDNPNQWDTWYTPDNGSASAKIQTETTGYEAGPTYTPNVAGLYGQQEYRVGNIIPEKTYNDYEALKQGSHSSAIPADHAEFSPAYVVTAEVLEATKGEISQTFYKGATLAKDGYTTAEWNAIKDKVSPAYIVTNTIQLSETDYIYRGTYLTSAQKEKYETDYSALAAEINSSIVPAYFCTKEGKYGGNYYETGHNYRGLEAFSSMSESDRSKFTFNYDAFDLLIDPTYGKAQGYKYQYDSKEGTLPGANDNAAHYSLPTSINYTATYKGSSNIAYKADDGSDTNTDTRKELTNTEFESLLNERYYYSPITVKQAKMTGSTTESYPYYVVNTSMFVGDTPYTVGEIVDIDTYNAMSTEAKANITTYNFADEDVGKTFYYCREAYKIETEAAGGKKVTNVMDSNTSTNEKSYGETVPVGTVISADNFKALTNNQANFVIHGLAPTETSTLYMTPESDIDDLSKDKIITVVYQYDYIETDMGGMNITPVTEYHVLNIHLQFKSGVPTIEDIQAPDIVLPGTTVSIKEPFVTPGAYEVTGGGWELFDDKDDAESHTNGIEYSPNMDPLYLYQHNYQVAYYAQTYLGKTYSNAVPVSVANYHDLKKVMDSKEHHYYIDHKDIFDVLKVEPKIYINDYTTDDPATSQNGLDLFKNLYDLSVLTSPTLDSKGLIDSGTFKGHKPLNERVKGGKKLEFFLRTDISRDDDPAIANEWTPIAGEKVGEDYVNCFQGTFHGDGHTLSGLDNSLFGQLCGKVYNLGVTGSFTGAGIVDTGEGYVENCWVNTTGEPDGSVYAVFGDPSRGDDEEPIQIVNSYCQEGKNYKTSPVTHGVATAKPDRAFYNGEVAYDLNGFYLYKRYCDKQVSSGATDQNYQYYTINNENKPVLQPAKYYASHPEYCSSGFLPDTPPTGFVVPMYVEDRFTDGDFRYAAGTIPTSADERLFVDTEHDNKEYFFPIWPDDYIFFGQMLTYGYGAKTHQSVPTAVARMDGRLSQTADANRVYRAPAYFSSKAMGVAHFNPNAYLAQRSADGTKEAYPRMTAIDFKGHYGAYEPYGTYGLANETGLFYTPLLDDDGLLSILNCDETRNLLAYAPASADNAKTYGVLNGYFVDPEYDSYYDYANGYRLVDEAPTSSIYGHIVQNNLKANDHLLVDKQDFNCPISYEFNNGKRMWYQRYPDNYVDRTTGWEGVSLPFTAELVTTHEKGEITHFYSGSASSANGTGSKIGHEYWLREFKEINLDTNSASEEVAVANFNYPDANAVDGRKNVENTFLWDHYYSQFSSKDENTDIYQKYYKGSRSLDDYPLLSAATPYLIGFPGDTYYEFDLSGTFVPQHTFSNISELEKQTITFASNPGITIKVSDDELVGVEKTLSSSKDYAFTFKPNYLTTTLNTTDTDSYTLNTVGDAYDQVTTETTVLPFRPYFKASSAPKSSPAPEYKGNVRSIVFTREPSQMYEEEDDISNMGELNIRSKEGKIVVTSTLQEAKDILIVTVGGALVDRYTIQPGETRETQASRGIYIVNTKKITVK